MLFRRRNPPDFRERLHIAMWPRRSWRRSIRYMLLRVRRMRATPHAVGLGCACGVFTAFTPFLGFHLLLAGLLAWMLRANILAAAAGTFFGNPLTYPVIWVSTYQFGSWVLGWKASREIVELTYVLLGPQEGFWSLVLPMFVGCLPLGLLAASATYFLAKKAVEAYREKKRQNALTTPSGARSSARRRPV
ncbi:MAG: DUF2062 domain-containing protein [Pseudomonadota bacterium]|nr:DUF2062 domain-containing protein [Pseudomonadota bacterium]